MGTVPDTTGCGEVIVRDVVPDSPAADSGLRVGDRIIAVDGDTVFDPGDLFAAIVIHRPGSVVDIEFARDGEFRTATATLAGIER